MAINPNTELKNRNCCYIAMSGFGKSQALKNILPSRGVRVVLWDPDNDHKANHYSNKKEFIAALIAGAKSGRGFRIGWDGEVSVEAFEWWCSVVWSLLDGNKELFIVVEELADVSGSSGKASDNWGQVNRKCRKYGGVLHWTTQRSQEVSKTAYAQAAIKYIGYPNNGSKVKDLAELIGVTATDLKSLQPLEFYRNEHVITQKVKFEFVPNEK